MLQGTEKDEVGTECSNPLTFQNESASIRAAGHRCDPQQEHARPPRGVGGVNESREARNVNKRHGSVKRVHLGFDQRCLFNSKAINDAEWKVLGVQSVEMRTLHTSNERGWAGRTIL